ncbi:MAG: hypothetical protein HC810_06575 [Acaryochloridaceae cyanobacterium RL_2_7]|nr:hypothetical protein [Acaryochloridaceae cyanobacterium RL_2_7]
MNGVVIPVPFHTDMPEAKDFVANMQKMFGVNPTWRTFASLDAMNAILVDSHVDTTRQEIQAKLQDKNFQVAGSTEAVRFLPNGDRIGRGVLVQIKPQAKGYRFAMMTP